ncbi:hydratase [Rheinheimera riviphila]|uniref:Hydratase n=1 Tax=Rheinheimera riviphila TaxID=1834037 RepID=A0A437QGB1_9GAMM|nr:fumarylacetoacetate hydrolase family protein [Rheinheimera riviphila]RVU33589.1 hydratase [Rheinheimera riviphila]
MNIDQLPAPVLSTSLLQQAAAILAERRKLGEVGPLLTDTLRPRSQADAFALQQQVAVAMAEPIAGWKCLLPTPDKIVVAPIYQSTVARFDNDTADIQQCALWPSIVPASQGLARVEPELAFVLSKDLSPRAAPYTEAEIDQAIGATHLALELIQSRFSHDSGAGFFDQLADGLFNQGLFLGPELQPTPGFDGSEFALQLTFNDGRVQNFNAVHPNQQPRAGLYWLVNFLSANNIALLAGQAVITGSYAGVLDLPFGEDMRFQYGDWGQFRLRFVTKTS